MIRRAIAAVEQLFRWDEFGPSPPPPKEPKMTDKPEPVAWAHEDFDREFACYEQGTIFPSDQTGDGFIFVPLYPASTVEALTAECDEAVKWRDIYLRERDEDRATFMRRAAALWEPLYNHALAERDALKQENERWRQNSRDTFEALCAMRDSINEHIPMPSLESDLLQGPETSVFCTVVAEAVVAALTPSVADPVAAYTVDLTGGEHLSLDVELIEKIAREGSHGPTEVVYLYARKERP